MTSPSFEAAAAIRGIAVGPVVAARVTMTRLRLTPEPPRSVRPPRLNPTSRSNLTDGRRLITLEALSKDCRRKKCRQRGESQCLTESRSRVRHARKSQWVAPRYLEA